MILHNIADLCSAFLAIRISKSYQITCSFVTKPDLGLEQSKVILCLNIHFILLKQPPLFYAQD